MTSVYKNKIVCLKGKIIQFQRDDRSPMLYKDFIEIKPNFKKGDICNFIKFSTNLINQKTYQCMTCSFQSNQPICEKCAKTCHSGHVLIKCNKSLVSGCSCGQNMLKSSCKCLISDHKFPICSKSIKNSIVTQHGFSCKSCNLSFICNACAENCHRGHMLDDLGIVEQVCHCESGGLVSCRCYHPEDIKEMAVIKPTQPI